MLVTDLRGQKKPQKYCEEIGLSAPVPSGWEYRDYSSE